MDADERVHDDMVENGNAPDSPGDNGDAEVVGAEQGAAPRGETFLQSLNESAARALRPFRTASPNDRARGGTTESGSGSDRSHVGAIACPALGCKQQVADVRDLKKHMTADHGGWHESDIAAATAPESPVHVKRGTLHAAIRAHQALAKEVESQNVGNPATPRAGKDDE